MGVEKATQYPIPETIVIGGRRIDKRTVEARRYMAVTGDLASDIGEPSAGQWLLIQRAAALTVQLENLDKAVASGEAVEAEEYVKLTGSLVRVLSTLGLKRQARDISPEADPIDPHAAAVRGQR